jgi:hypothetical protein
MNFRATSNSKDGKYSFFCESFKFEKVPPANGRNMRQKYNRGRRAKSECKNFTLPKDKNPGCGQEA